MYSGFELKHYSNSLLFSYNSVTLKVVFHQVDIFCYIVISEEVNRQAQNKKIINEHEMPKLLY